MQFHVLHLVQIVHILDLSLLSDYNLFINIAAETILLGFQNYILMLGTSVMIPTMLVHPMGGSDVSPYNSSVLFL